MKDTILVIGASGQIGSELCKALRHYYGASNVIATDMRTHKLLKQESDGPWQYLDVLNRTSLHSIVYKNKVTQIYLLAAMLSAKAEASPQQAWKLNMDGLINVLDVAREEKVVKVFWPSSIAVFGDNAPKLRCPQNASHQPTTIYGISKSAGESWCQSYYKKFGMDIRSVRYPGLISHEAEPGGGTTDYACEIFTHAILNGVYKSYLKADTRLPMMFMPDAIRAAIELMEAPAVNLSVRTSYNLAAMSFTVEELASAIKKYLPLFEITYESDYRQAIADSWPASINDKQARLDWGWKEQYGLEQTGSSMIFSLVNTLDSVPDALVQNLAKTAAV